MKPNDKPLVISRNEYLQANSNAASRAHELIPGGAHTYSKGDDQFPELAPHFISSGSGCRVLDPSGNSYLDWGMGLRSVILGHAYPRVVNAAIAEMKNGVNFTRPSPIELEVAELIVGLIPCAEMVKFAKNGSDVTTAAVRLARAATGRDLVAFPLEHPFYSIDDWFIGRTKLDAGVPDATRQLSLTFSFNDLDSLARLFAAHPDEIAAVITEPSTSEEPDAGFLEGVRELCSRHGAVLIFDEMITGFRWDARGAQEHYGVTPDLATFGKALGNGFSVSALAGRRELMELGGLDHDRPRVFLLSSTNGGETHALAAARETVSEVAERSTAHLWNVGSSVRDGLNEASAAAGLTDVVTCNGPGCSPNLVFANAGGCSAAELRTLFLQETIARGVLMPYIAPSFSHTLAEVDETIDAAASALSAVAQVVDGRPISDLLVGEPAQPVFRRFNSAEDGDS